MDYRITDKQLNALQDCLNQASNHLLERSPDSELNEITSEALSILEAVKGQSEEESGGVRRFILSDEDEALVLAHVEDRFDGFLRGKSKDTIRYEDGE